MYLDLTQSRSPALNRPKYPIARELARQYQGAGWVLAATVWGRLVRMVYVTELSPHLAEALDADLTDSYGTALVAQWLRSAEALPHIREMQAVGDVSAGRCSGWTYCPI